jgi:fatty acid kinase
MGTSGMLDASILRRTMHTYARALRTHRDELNSLNVYPVPDGDTGTNLLLTQEAVVAALEALSPHPGFAETRQAISEASLRGARGNSGVILSQVLRGICEQLPDDGEAGAGELARAVRHASDEAYRAVAKPAEGTVLTVLRRAAEAAEAAEAPLAPGAAEGCIAVAEAALQAARSSLAGTVDTLPELQRAGVVDAGGKGIVLLLDALWAAVAGETLSEPVGPLGPVGRPSAQTPAELAFAFEVQYLLELTPDEAEAALSTLRQQLGALGDSLVIVGGGGLYNVHVHTNEPGPAIEAGIGAGSARDLSVAYLPEQAEACTAGLARAVQVAEQVSALVAVVDGEGLARTFASLGAVVVRGGPGDNPSVGELLSAIAAAPADGVLVLPNHVNVVPAAELAAAGAAGTVRVVAATTIPSGLAAAAEFNPLVEMEENAKAMSVAAERCRSGEIAVAEREVTTPVGPVRSGQWVAMTDGTVVATGDSPAEVAWSLARILASGDAELATLIVGAQVEQDQVRPVDAAVQDALPGCRVDVVDGGGRRHPFLLGVE